jgi:osmotically-inducible protein OsmY
VTATGAVANPLAISTNQFSAGTNQFVLNTNQFGTNQLGLATNQLATNLAPTSQLGFTNRILSSNTLGVATNANPLLMRDQALSETDRRLLFQIRAAVFGPNQAAAPLAGTPIHFILRDGSVRLVGTVPTVEDRQRIENLVQQVPGVVRVFDALQVTPTGAQPVAPTAQ